MMTVTQTSERSALPTAYAAEGVRLYNQGAFERAFASFSRAAEAEDPDGRAWLGALYANGEGTAASLSRSFAHYRRAAEQDHRQAQTNVGTMLVMGQGIAADAEAGAAWLDPTDPEPLEKGYFLMLRRNDSLAKLNTRFDGETGLLTIGQPDGTRIDFDLDEPEGRAAIEDFFADYLGDACAGRPRLVEAEGHKFTDVSVISPAMMRAVSVINLASVRDLGERYGEPLHPLRFRGNIHFNGLAPWAELDWVGQEVTIGSARFRCVLRTKRCAAIDVNPVTGRRDTNLTRALVSLYGHPDCGVYLEVMDEGPLQVGDKISSEAHAAV